MAFRVNIDLKDSLVNLIAINMAGTTGTAGTANLKIYSGTQATSATAGSVGTLGTEFGVFLVQIDGIGWSSGTGGTAVFASTAGYTGTAVTSGTAVWARLERVSAAGTYRIDGDVGTASNNVFTINVVAIEDAEIVTITSADIYMS
jgi:hypothetical protein